MDEDADDEEEEEEEEEEDANEELDVSDLAVGSQSHPSYMDMIKSLHVEDMNGEEINDR